MIKKKLIATLTISAVLFSTTLSLGAPAKAATLNGTTYAAISQTLMFNPKYDTANYTDGTTDSHILFDKIPGATKYHIVVSAPINSTIAKEYDYGYSKIPAKRILNPTVPGQYYVFLTAYDADGKIIRDELYEFISDGKTATFYKGWVQS